MAILPLVIGYINLSSDNYYNEGFENGISIHTVS